MTADEAGRQLWAALRAYLRAGDMTEWWSTPWDGLPQWMREVLAVVATHWAQHDEGD